MTQVAVITGAGQGLGRVVALKLASEGIVPVLVGRTAEKLHSVAGEISASGGTSHTYTADVTDSKAVDGLRDWLTGQFDHIDMLINCAGEALIRPLDQTTEADWDRIIGVNLKAPYLMSRALLPLLKGSSNASIVNVLSKAALLGVESITAYTAAKTGLLGFSRSLAAELRPLGIRVVPLCPGPMDTPMRWAATPDFDRNQVIDPQFIAATIWHIVTLPRGVVTSELLVEVG